MLTISIQNGFCDPFCPFQCMLQSMELVGNMEFPVGFSKIFKIYMGYCEFNKRLFNFPNFLNLNFRRLESEEARKKTSEFQAKTF